MCCDSGVSDRPEQLRAVAEQLAAEAAAFVRRRRAELFGGGAHPIPRGAVQAKSTPTDPVTLADTETEALLRDRLAQVRPGEAILGEEGGGPGSPRPAPCGGCSTRSTER